MTRQQRAGAVLAQLREVGPQTTAQIRADLGLTKREVEDALYILGGRGEVEYAWPVTSPLTHKAVASSL